MSQISTKLKKYGLLATGITGAAVSAEAQVDYTETNFILEDDNYNVNIYDLNNDEVDDIQVYRSQYTSSNTFSTYTYSYLNIDNKSQTDYKVQFTGLMSKGATVDDELTFNNSLNENSLNPSTDDVFYFGFRIQEQTCGSIAASSDNVLTPVNVAREKKPLCNYIPTGNYRYGWMKFTYDTFTVQVNTGSENTTPSNGPTLARKATEQKTGLRFEGFALEKKDNVGIKIGDDGTVNSVSEYLTATDAGLQIYPNPTKDILTIQGEVESVKMLDLTGNVVRETSDNILTLSNLKSGLYLLQLQTAKGTVLEKIQKL